MAQVVDEMDVRPPWSRGQEFACKVFVKALRMIKSACCWQWPCEIRTTAPASGRRRERRPSTANPRPLNGSLCAGDAGRRRTARMPVRRKAVRKKPDAPIPAEKEEGQRQVQQPRA